MCFTLSRVSVTVLIFLCLCSQDPIKHLSWYLSDSKKCFQFFTLLQSFISLYFMRDMLLDTIFIVNKIFFFFQNVEYVMFFNYSFLPYEVSCREIWSRLTKILSMWLDAFLWQLLSSSLCVISNQLDENLIKPCQSGSFLFMSVLAPMGVLYFLFSYLFRIWADFQSSFNGLSVLLLLLPLSNTWSSTIQAC